MTEYSAHFLSLCDDLDTLMAAFSHTKKDIGYGYRWTFSNGQWIDCIDYKAKGNHIIRLGRGARFVRTYPMLYGVFDEVAKVIAKIIVHDTSTLQQKHLAGILQLLEQAPQGIGYLD